jgi:hypothetical protein
MDEGTMKTPILKCRLYWYFCLGWCSNFVGSESGQKQSVKLTPAEYGLTSYNTTQQPPPPHSHTLSLYTVLYVYFGKGGRVGEVRERVGGSKIPT